MVLEINGLKDRKVLVVYYSLEGHCQRIAQYLAKTYGFDILALQPVKDLDPNSASKHWMGRFQVLFNQTVPLTNLPDTVGQYDLVLLGTPVWMGTYAPALQSFIAEVPLEGKQVALFTTYEKDAGDVFVKLQERLPSAEIVGEISLCIKGLSESDFSERIDNWLYSLMQ